MYYFATHRIEQAIEALGGTGASDYFKTYLVLKAFGLSMDPPHDVVVDTTNTEQSLNLLFFIEGLEERLAGESRPFYNPFGNEALRDHAARSIIQTHVKRFHDGSIPISVNWLVVKQRPDRKWEVGFAREYPQSLGRGKDGLAKREEEQITIPTADFLIWLYRYERFADPPLFGALFERMKADLNFHEAEISLIFDKTRDWVGDDPFTTEAVDWPHVIDFILTRLNLGTDSTVLTPSPRPVFSSRKVNRILGVFRKMDEAKWWSVKNVFDEAQDVLLTQKAVLLVGPPGTGKTRLARLLAEATAEPERIHFFQFHAAYTYQSFVESLEPQVDDISGNLHFQPIAGRFLEILELAKHQPQVVILDELNRADVPRVFGEILVLLEYREEISIPRMYAQDEMIWVPNQLYVIATMNDIDKSTFDVDFALRRRFGQVRLEPDPGAVLEVMRDSGCTDDDLMKICASVLTQVQQFYPLGHAYFRDVTDREALRAVYRRRIRPAVQAYLGKFREQELEEVDTLFKQVYEAPSLEDFLGAED